ARSLRGTRLDSRGGGGAAGHSARDPEIDRCPSKGEMPLDVGRDASMTDDFDRSLAAALAPPERLPDRKFVAQVQAFIALEDRLAAERRALAAGLATQLAGLLAVAAGIWVLSRVEPVAGLFAQSPAVGLAILLALFGFVVLLMAAETREEPQVEDISVA